MKKERVQDNYPLSSDRSNLEKVPAVDIIIKEKIQDRQETGQFNDQNIGIKSDQVKEDQQKGTRQQLHIVDNTDHFEIISIEVVIYQLYRLCNMVSVGDHQLGIILHHCYHDGSLDGQRVYFRSIHDHTYPQKVEQHLVLPGDDNVVRRQNVFRFDSRWF